MMKYILIQHAKCWYLLRQRDLNTLLKVFETRGQVGNYILLATSHLAFKPWAWSKAGAPHQLLKDRENNTMGSIDTSELRRRIKRYTGQEDENLVGTLNLSNIVFI